MNQGDKFSIALKSELLTFVDRLEDIFNHNKINTDDLLLIRVYIHSMNHPIAMDHIINKVLPWKDHIINKDESFFRDNKQIFGQLPKDKVDFFYKKHQLLEQEDKDEIWDFFNSFIEYADCYLDLKKKK
jgi:hypothetical protein